jgi:hypothetical protein
VLVQGDDTKGMLGKKKKKKNVSRKKCKDKRKKDDTNVNDVWKWKQEQRGELTKTCRRGYIFAQQLVPKINKCNFHWTLGLDKIYNQYSR